MYDKYYKTSWGVPVWQQEKEFSMWMKEKVWLKQQLSLSLLQQKQSFMILVFFFF